MKPLIVLAVLASLTGGGVASAGASGPVPTCRGLPATIVGSTSGPQSVQYGTEGDDVIVSNGVGRVVARGGNDVVCVTAGGKPNVDAGPGDDVVDAQQSPANFVFLGAGDDTYIGNRGDDRVDTDIQGSSESAEPGLDTVSTGDGDDVITTGTPGLVDQDQLDMGDGNDSVFLEGTATGSVGGGAGRDAIQWGRVGGSERWTFDQVRGRATRGTTPVGEWTGMEEFNLMALSDHELTFIGSAAAESLRTTGLFPERAPSTGSVSAAMGQGADVVWVDGNQELTIRGGPGLDRLRYRAPNSAYRAQSVVTMDLSAGTVSSAGQTEATFTSFENALLQAPSGAQMIGNQQPNRMALQACQGRISGRGGNDFLDAIGIKSCGPNVEERGVVIQGGAGDDRLHGSYWEDSLYGGAGYDTAYGGNSTDLCRVEKSSYCER